MRMAMHLLPGCGYRGMISILDIVLNVNINILYLAFCGPRAEKGVGSTNDCQRPFAVQLGSDFFTVRFLKSVLSVGDIE